MASEHTPGPWKVLMHGKAAYVTMHIGKAGLPASATGDAEFAIQPYIRPDEATANARLIAAAPDLLAALKTARNQIVALGIEAGHSADAAVGIAAHVDAAIAKATGK